MLLLLLSFKTKQLALWLRVDLYWVSTHASSVLRDLPVSGAVGHHGDNLVEKMLTVLKPLPGHVTDVQVDMLELTSLQRSPHSDTTLAPGCLAQTQ